VRREIIEELKSIVGDEWVVSAREAIEGYLYDETPIPIRPEACGDVVVVKPSSSEEVSRILQLAIKYLIPVFPRGWWDRSCWGMHPNYERDNFVA